MKVLFCVYQPIKTGQNNKKNGQNEYNNIDNNKNAIKNCSTHKDRIVIKTNFKVDKINSNDFEGKKVTFDVVKQKYEKELNGTCKEK